MSNQFYPSMSSSVYDEVSCLFRTLLKRIFSANLPTATRNIWVDRVHRAMSRGTVTGQLLALENVKKEWEGR